MQSLSKALVQNIQKVGGKSASFRSFTNTNLSTARFLTSGTSYNNDQLLSAFPVSLAATNIQSISSSIQARNFHATTVHTSAERKRRRRRGGDGAVEDSNSDGSFSPSTDLLAVTNPDEFQVIGEYTLQRIETAIDPMRAVNDPFRVKRSPDKKILTIEVDPKWGSYVIELDDREMRLTLSSPVSGAHTYFYSKKKEAWIDTIDLHSFEGILVRDLIRHCQGVPKL